MLLLVLTQLGLAEKMPGPPGDKFVEVMSPFLEGAKEETTALKERYGAWGDSSAREHQTPLYK